MATVLLIEDDPDIRESVAMCLGDEGYAVHHAGDGREGLQQLRTLGRPCVVLHDMMMPVSDGAALLAAMQRDPELASIPVIAVSAGLAKAPKGAAAFMRKPFEISELLEVVNRYCRHAR